MNVTEATSNVTLHINDIITKNQTIKVYNEASELCFGSVTIVLFPRYILITQISVQQNINMR